MPAADALLRFTDRGFYCPQADCYIDPWRPVNRAIITHAHADHARWGHRHYLCHPLTAPILRHRIGPDISIETRSYGETFTRNGVRISLHPAGHILGSAQVRLEYRGEIWVLSGDYKTTDDGFCTPFEPVACHHFVTESTFGLPVYHWRPAHEVAREMNAWWRDNQEKGRVSVLLGYALGKAQRMLNMVDPEIGPIFTHGAVENLNAVVRKMGQPLPDTQRVRKELKKADYRGGLVLAPPSAYGTSWMRKFDPYQAAIGSGWMALRGARRRRAADRGFVLSDHADWPGLNEAIRATGAGNIYVTHGYTDIFARWLQDQGYHAEVVETQFEGELGEIQEGTQSQEAQQEEAAA
mgnify:FL=1